MFWRYRQGNQNVTKKERLAPEKNWHSLMISPHLTKHAIVPKEFNSKQLTAKTAYRDNNKTNTCYAKAITFPVNKTHVLPRSYQTNIQVNLLGSSVLSFTSHSPATTLSKEKQQTNASFVYHAQRRDKAQTSCFCRGVLGTTDWVRVLGTFRQTGGFSSRFGRRGALSSILAPSASRRNIRFSFLPLVR